MSKPKPAGPHTPVRTAYDGIQLWYTIQHWTVLTVFPFMQTSN